MREIWKKLRLPLACVLAAVSLGAAVLLALPQPDQGSAAGSGTDLAIMDRYDMYMNNRVSNALDGVLDIKKVYWLSDDDMVAPKPDAGAFGVSKDPAELGWLIEQAQPLLNGQELMFGVDTEIPEWTEVNYYMDETILAVTWKQPFGFSMYTFCEVKLAHPSQFRRFLAGGEYGSEIQLQTTQMADSVNAVLASAGDFYNYRRQGVIVYDGKVMRADAKKVETCYIAGNGDLMFSHVGELGTVESAQKFVDEHGIRFSVAFGPILVENGEPVEIDRNYHLGAPTEPFPRAVLCQLDELHYVVVAVNRERTCTSTISVLGLSEVIRTLPVKMAYCLDGGQTATVAMNGKVLNRLANGSQRYISDIIYFATALPEGE